MRMLPGSPCPSRKTLFVKYGVRHECGQDHIRILASLPQHVIYLISWGLQDLSVQHCVHHVWAWSLLQVIPFSAFSFPKFLMLRHKCTSQVGLSIELEQACRICPESKKTGTKNAPLTPPPKKIGVEMCSIVFSKKHFSLKFGNFSF